MGVTSCNTSHVIGSLLQILGIDETSKHSVQSTTRHLNWRERLWAGASFYSPINDYHNFLDYSTNFGRSVENSCDLFLKHDMILLENDLLLGNRYRLEPRTSAIAEYEK